MVRKSFLNTKEENEKLPYTSGLYFFYDENDNLLYLGKSKKLKSRIIEHRRNNLMDREGKFYLRIQRNKGYTNPDEWHEDLKTAFKDFRMRYLFHNQSPLVIDAIFHRVKKIVIEEMPHEMTKQKEKELIETLKPTFNSQTASDEYYSILNEFD